jgi:hypothetical protein
MKTSEKATLDKLEESLALLISVLDGKDIEPIDTGTLNAAAFIMNGMLQTWQKRTREG